jgi:hypothetical protein
MKAISLWQPWASAIACGAKRIETRSWATNYTGPIAIHAAKKWNVELRGTAFYLMNQQGGGDLRWLLSGLGIQYVSDFPLSAIVATAELECCRSTDSLINHISPLEQSLGNYTSGRFGWVLSNIKPLSKPIPAVGRQQLWEWNEEVLA